MKLGERGQHRQESSVHVGERDIRVSHECLTARQKRACMNFPHKEKCLPLGFRCNV